MAVATAPREWPMRMTGGLSAANEKVEVFRKNPPLPDAYDGLEFRTAVAADVAGRDVQLSGQMPDKRRVGAGAEAVTVEEMGRVSGSPPVEEVQSAAGDGEIPFGGFDWVC